MSRLPSGKPCRKFVNPTAGPCRTFSVERPSDYNWTLITSDDAKFQVHSEALVNQSDYFAALLTSGMHEQQNRRVEFTDIDSVALERFLIYVTTGSVVVGEDSFLSLLQLACRFQSKSLTELLSTYVKSDFLNIKQEDISEVFTSRIHPGIADLCRNLIQTHIISENMLGLSFEVVAIVLHDDAVVTKSEDHVLVYVREYCDRWNLDTDRELVLLNTVRLPRLSMTAFERAAISIPSFKKTKSFETIADQSDFIDLIDEEQLRNRAGNDVFITMFWFGDVQTEFHLSQNSHSKIFSMVRSLRLSYKNELRTIASKHFEELDRCILSGYNFTGPSAYLSYANHLFTICPVGLIAKLSFKNRGVKFSNGQMLNYRSENIMEIEQVIGVDYDKENFYLSCLTNVADDRVFVLCCRLVGQDILETKRVQIPSCVSKILARRMVYRKNAICILTAQSEIFVYLSESDTFYKLPAADEYRPKYIQIAVQDDTLYVFDYSECPVQLQDFSQPFSHFDKIRLYSLSQRKWTACYPVDLNRLRQTGYNELIDFNIEMYFIQKRLYFLWTNASRLHIFRVDEEIGRTDYIVNYKVPNGANGVILLPAYYHEHNDTTVLEKYVYSFCQKKLEYFGSNPEHARKISEWRDKYLDGVTGSGLFPNALDSFWQFCVRHR